MSQRLTPQRRSKAKRLRTAVLADVSTEDIADRFSISPNAVSKVRKWAYSTSKTPPFRRVPTPDYTQLLAEWKASVADVISGKKQ